MIQDGVDTATLCPYPNDTTGIFKAVDGTHGAGINLAFVGLDANADRQRYSEIKTRITGNDLNPEAADALASQMRFIVADLTQAPPMTGGEDGGVRVFQISGGEFTFNPTQMDIDFRLTPDLGAPSPAPSFFVEGSTGNVGLGTATPEEMLDLEGDGPGIRMTNTGTAGGGWRLKVNGNAGRLNVRNLATNNDVMRVDPGANAALLRLGVNTSGVSTSDTVAIGSTHSGDAVLQVQGSIVVDGVTVHADYVFEPDYELDTIDEHLAFAMENKHLPGLPKAPEGLKGPVDLVSHQMGILEELETAHLYIGQLHRKIEQLEASMQELATQVAQTTDD